MRYLSFLAMCLSAAVAGAALPNAVYTVVDEDCCNPASLELTQGGAAYLREERKLFTGTAVETDDGSVRLEFPDQPASGTLLHPNDSSWVDLQGRLWKEESTAKKADQAGWTPFRITVKDSKGKVLEGLEYRYWVTSVKGEWDPALVRPLTAVDGVCELLAPADCMVSLSPEHPDLNHGYGSNLQTIRAAGAPAAEVTVERDRKVSGRVVDAATKKPVAGAVIRRLLFTPPVWQSDEERSVTTGADGGFEIRGINFLGVQVTHPDYALWESLGDKVWAAEGDLAHVEVSLKKGTDMKGSVFDSGGNPLAGVKVETDSGNRFSTGADGNFLVKNTRKDRPEDRRLIFKKDGYQRAYFERGKIPKGGIKITLKPMPVLKGRVVMADGTPVAKFHITAGPSPNPARYDCANADIVNQAGQFALTADEVSKDGKYWVGVSSPDTAPWSGLVDTQALIKGDCCIILSPGVTLKANVTQSAAEKRPLTAKLRLISRQVGKKIVAATEPEANLVERTLTLMPGEPLAIPHLSPGNYVLGVAGEGVTPAWRAVTVAGSDVDGGEIRLGGTGSISGRVKDPKRDAEQEGDVERKWQYASGTIETAAMKEVWGKDGASKHALEIHTDADGNFHVDGVPLGEVTVFFEYALSGCLRSGVTATVEVKEGQDGVVKFE